MPNIEPVAALANSEAQQLVQSAERRIGQASNMLRTLAHSPGVLEAYLHFNHIYEQAKISPRLRGLITTTIAQQLGGEYILAVAATLGVRQGLSLDELEAARRGESADPKIAAVLHFGGEAMKAKGKIDSSLVDALRGDGYSDEELVEIAGFIGLNLFRNYFNLIAGTEVDGPDARTLQPVGESWGQPTVSA